MPLFDGVAFESCALGSCASASCVCSSLLVALASVPALLVVTTTTPTTTIDTSPTKNSPVERAQSVSAPLISGWEASVFLRERAIIVDASCKPSAQHRAPNRLWVLTWQLADRPCPSTTQAPSRHGVLDHTISSSSKHPVPFVVCENNSSDVQSRAPPVKQKSFASSSVDALGSAHFPLIIDPPQVLWSLKNFHSPWSAISLHCLYMIAAVNVSAPVSAARSLKWLSALSPSSPKIRGASSSYGSKVSRSSRTREREPPFMSAQHRTPCKLTVPCVTQSFNPPLPLTTHVPPSHSSLVQTMLLSRSHPVPFADL